MEFHSEKNVKDDFYFSFFLLFNEGKKEEPPIKSTIVWGHDKQRNDEQT